MRHHLFVMLVGIGCAGLSVPAQAQSPLPPEVATVLRQVVAHNTDIASARASWQSSRQSVEEAKGIWDLTLATRLNQQKDVGVYNAQVGQSLNREYQSGQLSLTQRLLSGADLALGTTLVRQTTGGGTPYNGSVFATLNQPLFKDFGVGPTQYGIALAESELARAEALFQATVASVMKTALTRYSDYVLAVRRVAIAKAALQVSDFLWNLAQRKTTLAVATELDLLQATIAQNTAADAVATTQYEVDRLADGLALLAGGPVLVTADPVMDDLMFPEWTEAQANTLALTANADIRAAKAHVTIQTLSWQYAQNQALPNLSLVASLSYNQSGTAFSDAYGMNQPSYGLGISAELPLGNRSSTAAAEKARLARQNADQVLQAKINEVRAAIRTAIQATAMAETHLGYAAKNNEMSKRQLHLQTRRYELGLETIDKVIDAQKNSTQAAVAYDAATHARLLAAFDMAILTGTYLEWMGEQQ